MRFLLLIIFLISFIAGCINNNEVPSDIFNREKMQAIMWDMIQADAFTQQFIKKDSLKNPAEENARLQKLIFRIHKVTKEEFYKSYNYYKDHTDLMRTMLDSMLVHAERSRIKPDNRFQRDKLKKFSVNRLK